MRRNTARNFVKKSSKYCSTENLRIFFKVSLQKNGALLGRAYRGHSVDSSSEAVSSDFGVLPSAGQL